MKKPCLLEVDDDFFKIAKPIIETAEYESLRHFVAHRDYSVYAHSFAVALLSYHYGVEHHLALDYPSLVRGALLHDYYLYDWHKTHRGHRLHGFRHPAWSLHNAILRYDLNEKEKNIIRSHMWPLTFLHFPRSKEAWIVMKMDHREAFFEVRNALPDPLWPLTAKEE